MKRVVMLLIVPVAFLWLYILDLPRSHGPGILAPEPPRQEMITPPQPFPYKDHVIYRLAHFELTARVLSSEAYRFDREAELSPIDLALGWGQMSDESVLEYFSISQSRRWYWWRYKKLPIAKQEVIRSSANMHMVPSDDYIKRQLKKVRRGDIVRLKGYLIEARSQDGWVWRSSLSRTDSGDRACEVVYVEDFEVINPSSAG